MSATSSATASPSEDWSQWLLPAIETAALVSGNWPLLADPAPRQWTSRPRVAVRTPPLAETAVHATRAFAATTAERWGAPERADDIGIVMSELLTNALLHALPDADWDRLHRAIRVGLIDPGPCLLCVVTDPSRKLPIPGPPDILADAGRGLHVVSAISDNWGYATLGDRGKVVWALFWTAPRGAGARRAESRLAYGRHHRDQRRPV